MSLRSLFLFSFVTWLCPSLVRWGTQDSPPVFALPSLLDFFIQPRFPLYSDPGDLAERSNSLDKDILVPLVGIGDHRDRFL